MHETIELGLAVNGCRHELRVERWERAHPDHKDWTLHGSYSEAEVDDIAGDGAGEGGRGHRRG